MNKKLLSAIVLVVVLNSCKKYEEGPNFTLRTAMNRLTGEWLLKEEGPISVPTESTVIWEFDKDMDFEWRTTYSSNGSEQILAGDWEWQDNKDGVEMVLGAFTIETDILKLTKDELRVNFAIGGHGVGESYIWEFEKQE